MKKYIFLAASALTLASCSSDDFLGDTPGSTPTSANSAIKFDGNAGKISRTSNTGTPAEMLGKEFKIYGVKSGATSGSGYTPVFQNYLLWYDDANKNTTTNKSGWEYVGTTGTHGTATLNSNQYIKFWDYASADYRFVAGAPSSAFTFTPGEDNTLVSATIKGFGGHIDANPTGTTTGTANTFNPIYVADPKVVAQNDYKTAVQFNFVRQQSMVRVGIYETIPGYRIKDITFYEQGENGLVKKENNHNITLTSTTADYFVGGKDITGTITYDWTSSTKPTYSLKYEETGLKKNKNWYGGALDGVKAKTSTHQTISELYGTDLDMAKTTGYFTVMTNPSITTATPILIKCNYTLESEDNSGETINVTGATAAIPAAYSKWEVNTRYTYLFKISEKTNGYTGSDDPGHVGLYPITFEAMVKDEIQGTITTIATPSITTSQKESVDENGGIKYIVNKDIDVTVTDNTNGAIKDLHTNNSTTVGHIAVYKFNAPITEAEVQVKGTDSGIEVTDGIADNNIFTFKPTDAGYYAIQYLTTEAVGNTPAAYTYKVVYVADATK